MSLLKNLNTSANSQGEEDKLGGGGVLDTNIYDAVVKIAYLSTADSGAIGLNVHLLIGDKEHRETFWVQSGNAKGNKTFYVKDGKEYDLPGFITATSLSLLTVGKQLVELDTEPKIIKLWDSSAKAEVNTEVQMITELLGQKVQVALQKQTVNKQVKDASGGYVDTAETREKNEVSKFFREGDGFSVPELLAQATEAKFRQDWLDKFAGKVINKAKKVDGLTTGAPNGGGAPTGRTSLFAK